MVEFDGKPIQNLYDFTYALRGKKPGDEVMVKVIRRRQAGRSESPPDPPPIAPSWLAGFAVHTAASGSRFRPFCYPGPMSSKH